MPQGQHAQGQHKTYKKQIRKRIAVVNTRAELTPGQHEDSTEIKEHLDFKQFYVAWDKNKDGDWNVKKFQPFKFSVNKLRTRMMRQSDPYFVARIDKQKIWDFLHPQPKNIAGDTLNYALPDLCLKKNLLQYPLELKEFQQIFFPEDDPNNISNLCRAVFRLRYWCAFDRLTK